MKLLACALAATLASTAAQAGSSCTGTNDNGDATCNVDCDTGQTAECSHGTGSSTPECRCTGGDPARLLLPAPRRRPMSPWLRVADAAPLPPAAPLPGVTYLDLPGQLASRIRTRTDWVVRNLPVDTPAKWFRVDAVTGPVVQVVSADIGSPVAGEPRSAFREVFRLKNCSPSQQSLNARYTQEDTGNVELALTSGFDSSVQATTGFTAKILDSLGVNASTVETQKISLSSAQRNAWTRRGGTEVTVPVVVDRQTELVGYVSRLTRTERFPFTAVAVVEADVTYEFHNSAGNSATANQKYTRKLSSLLPRQEDRSFTLAGRLDNATSAETDLQYLSRPVDPADHVACPVPDLLTLPPASALVARPG